MNQQTTEINQQTTEMNETAVMNQQSDDFYTEEHREKMTQVCNELLDIENTCYCCNEYIEHAETRLYSSILFHRYVFCDWRCLSEGDELIRSGYYN